MKVKICGLRTVEDAVACSLERPDAIGMVVNIKASPRCVDTYTAKEIVACIPAGIAPVTVMAPASAREAVEIAVAVRPRIVQLQGYETPGDVIKIKKALPGLKVVKAIHMGDGGEMENARSYEGIADALLLDTQSPAGGGSGKVHDWAASARIVSSVKMPVMLAGGLSPANVADAIKTVRPYAVDVASGVEGPDRRKDITLVKKFIEIARNSQ
jgi:phosphoribosylanthranilate isomerase